VQCGAYSHVESLCVHGESNVRDWLEPNAVFVLTNLKVAANQEVVTSQRFFYIMPTTDE
jgi:hypothetical protein